MRLVTAGIVSMSELDCMCLDDIDDLNITLAAEASAKARWQKEHSK